MGMIASYFVEHTLEHARRKALIAVLFQTFNGNKTCLELER